MAVQHHLNDIFSVVFFPRLSESAQRKTILDLCIEGSTWIVQVEQNRERNYKNESKMLK